MKIVVDTISECGGCRVRIVEILSCQEGKLLVWEKGRLARIAVDQIVDWAPVYLDAPPALPIGDWLKKPDPDFVCF